MLTVPDELQNSIFQIPFKLLPNIAYYWISHFPKSRSVKSNIRSAIIKKVQTCYKFKGHIKLFLFDGF